MFESEGGLSWLVTPSFDPGLAGGCDDAGCDLGRRSRYGFGIDTNGDWPEDLLVSTISKD